MEGCERGGDEGRVRKCCLSAATACLCLRSESHYNAEALVCAYEHVCVCAFMCVCVCQTLSYVTIKMLSWGYCTDDSRGSLLLEPGWRLFWSTSEKSNQRRAAFFFTEPEKKKKKKVINLFLAVTFKYISLIITHRRTNLQSFS